ncbi:alpha/beta fold hydrolase [Aestuariispira insulae]|uniref:Pimeloyl-ACP methyl ester carboxylesterase n=1 Tax=Aestuariispira insulae TaxID=1461337 RepID=A0A3D9HIB0_9PROT|nr:alpha/beta hydrolase [Aestuariispira insulae]RED49174.1 pimeloyl-ACP methyl ester carboxylesterase [Aestuariispira insulae]
MKCTINNAEIHYEIRGEGRPIVLIHGFCLDRRALTHPLEPILEAQGGWKRIYLDLPGMGRSPASKSIENSDQMLASVSAFIGQILGDETYTLFGYSYGGYLAQGLVREQPERITGVALLCPVIFAPHEERSLPPETCLVRDDAFLDAIPADQRAEFETNTVIQTQAVWERTQREIQAGLDCAKGDYCDRLQALGYRFSFPVFPLSKPFDKPSLVLTGRQDNIVGSLDQFNLAESYPRATIASLDRAGHHLQIEQDRLFDILVADWLERVRLER